jgi:hypothetical protein
MTRLSLSAALVITTLLPPLWAQSSSRKDQGSSAVPPCQVIRGGTSATAQVPPYVDEPIEQLKKMVPDLSRVKPDSAQDPAESGAAAPSPNETELILSKTGEVIAVQLHRLPNLISKEEIRQPIATLKTDSVPWQEQMKGVQDAVPVTEYRIRVYGYRIVRKQKASGSDVLDEFRTDMNGQPIDDSAHNSQGPFSFGFATTWLIFLPGSLQKSNFKYLGQQEIGGRETYVLAFAQIPDGAGIGAVIKSSYGRCSAPLQGVAWIDQSTFQIVRMQTDLLAPLPGIDLNQLRSILNYGSVKIAGLRLLLWLPSDVETTWQTMSGAGEESHIYSHYRLFQSTARVLPNSEAPPR